MGCGWFYDKDPGALMTITLYLFETWGLWGDYGNLWVCGIPSLVVGSLALISTAFLCLSRHNKVFRLNDRWTLVSSMLLFTTLAFSFWLGMDDVSEGLPTIDWREYWTDEDIRSAQGNHVVSWLRLLLPIILTTAFVIFGAWRRAVRDAAVEAADEEV